MKTEEEIREAIKAAEQREDGLEYSEHGAAGGEQLLAVMCDASVEALQWVLEEEDGFVPGLAGYRARQDDDG